jgi:hypothetical protein
MHYGRACKTIRYILCTQVRQNWKFTDKMGNGYLNPLSSVCVCVCVCGGYYCGKKHTKKYLLSVTAVSDRFVVVVLKDDVPEEVVRNIFDKVPLDRELPCPLVLLPVIHALLKIHPAHHLSHPTKL